ncbi:hypothetical protein FB45DRAFT_1131368 [Roridomyces roridus]|uniref:Uncharacterized protein n=1 Tax=Roridomyces roridus TaxID=1738132 RepID=A0AAD7B222_9AGAR|nr:hypothetical protein FB45DRAFT_1131368 [Roridomyces roridus]
MDTLELTASSPISLAAVPALVLLGGGSPASYAVIALALVVLIVRLGHRQRPSEKLSRLENALHTTGIMLHEAKVDCSVNYAIVVELECRLLEAKHSVSKITAKMLESGSKEDAWIQYPQTMLELWKDINKCIREVKDIHVDILLVCEDELQESITYEVEYSRKALAAIRSPIGPLSTRRRRERKSTSSSPVQQSMSVVSLHFLWQ